MLYRVKKKTSIMNLKIKPEVHLEFKVAAEVLGTTMSDVLHRQVVKTINEARKEHAEKFARLLASLQAADVEMVVEVVDHDPGKPSGKKSEIKPRRVPAKDE